jgi:hypothetical protein
MDHASDRYGEDQKDEGLRRPLVTLKIALDRYGQEIASEPCPLRRRHIKKPWLQAGMVPSTTCEGSPAGSLATTLWMEVRGIVVPAILANKKDFSLIHSRHPTVHQCTGFGGTARACW